MSGPTADPIRCAIGAWQAEGRNLLSASISLTAIPAVSAELAGSEGTAASQCRACDGYESAGKGLLCETCVECWEDESLNMSICGKVYIWCNQSLLSCYPE
jgi:hypothetical protein